MSDERSRRQFLLASGAVGAGTLLAGCTGGGGDDSTTDGGDAGGTDAATTDGTGTDASGTTESGDGTEESTTEGGSYSVSMEPVGEVQFDAVPETVAVYCPGYADMAVALGHGDAVATVGQKSRYYTSYYDDLSGVTVDKGSLTNMYQEGIDKELFYEVDADLHLVDPNWLMNNFDGWEQSDVDEITEQVAPFLGNTIFRRTDSWHDYRYYSMYEAFEKVGQMFDATDRFEAFSSFHDDVLSTVESNLPAESERPSALLTFGSGDEPDAFSPYRVSDKGTNKKQFHDLGIGDALEGSGIGGLSTNDRGQIDYETMAEVDPESILIRGHETKTEQEFQETVVAYMESHPVASELTAVQNGMVFRGGPIYEGPIQNLFLTERFAKAYYPDSFSGELFDRDELASVITG
ncbi:ABC transporter substrate-binding protein [Halomarina salina]|uniref:ABC transporter substrate-binding protein n=1 Tax=Halomarina salina TaxID=1872699 RepID=A0ABD5RL84_9EURY|nr:ABC transporter substrate-binding protein [Halomarina salina]